MLTPVIGHSTHFLFWQSFPDFTIVEIDCVEFLGFKENRKNITCLFTAFCLLTVWLTLKSEWAHTNNFVYSIMVIKSDKAESSLLPCGAFLHDVNAFDLSIFLKILANVVLLSIFLDATNKDLLHCQMGAWFIGVLKWSALVSTHQTITYL